MKNVGCGIRSCGLQVWFVGQLESWEGRKKEKSGERRETRMLCHQQQRL